MLKNLPEAAEKKLVEIFNNVLISGCVPEDWEIGEVVLALKKIHLHAQKIICQ